jgi:hypothetical protein
MRKMGSERRRTARKSERMIGEKFYMMFFFSSDEPAASGVMPAAV